MEIFLLVLKVIGIILLSILGLILGLVLLILLTPFRYHLKGKYHDKEPDVLLNFHFWFHLVSAKVIYNDKGLVITLRIFFIKKTLVSPDKKKKEAEDKDKDKEEGGTEAASEETEAETGEDKSDTENVEAKTEEAEKSETEKTDQTEEAEDTDESEDAEGTEKTETEEGSDQVTEAVEEKSKLDKIVDKIKGIYDKGLNFKEKLDKKKTAVEWLLKQPETLRMLLRAKNQLIKILKGILPRKFKGYFTLGLEDPKTMGMICMYAGIFYPYGCKDFEFTPVFGEKIIDGEGEIKGRIILGAILLHLLKLVLCRDFFKTLKNLKKFKKLWR